MILWNNERQLQICIVPIVLCNVRNLPWGKYISHYFAYTRTLAKSKILYLLKWNIALSHSAQLTHFLRVWHQGILSTSFPFVPSKSGLPFPRCNLIVKNLRSKVKIKRTPVSTASSWLISLLFDQDILSTPVPFVPWQSGLPFPRYNTWLWKFKVKWQMCPSQRSIQLTHFLLFSHESDQAFLRYDKYNDRLWKKRIWTFMKKKIAKKVSDRIPPKLNQVETMTRGIYLPSSVAIESTILTLSQG